MKSKLLDHLKNDIYCRIGLSKIHGVGVIAIKDIPKGVNPFKNLSVEKEKVIELNDKDLKNIDNETKKVLKDFFGHGKNSHSYEVLYAGPNYINISYYLNHSSTPNLELVDNKDGYLNFKTCQKIKKGEELFINYGEYE
jgi:SET domain-containing protein